MNIVRKQLKEMSHITMKLANPFMRSVKHNYKQFQVGVLMHASDPLFCQAIRDVYYVFCIFNTHCDTVTYNICCIFKGCYLE